ncbi:hypothetical protein P5P86_10405 [Nocardioides sp. BP30]|uniref:hypothetical protein n=1 Tax=Nocardioides sp. BP30 TaxID=3036374 RepID=UPI0024689639|nr:hypothetical protein [Nocardioides sp. BP30]WGL50379.1 hypothetical protein P5P86_10405 [Nocardioides sp. BP30]
MSEPSESDAERLRRLRAEVTGLEARLGEPTGRRTARGGWWRGPTVALCLVLLGVVAPLSIVAAWAHDEISDTDRYVSTVAPLARDPQLQRAISTRITREIASRIDVSGLTASAAAALQQRGAPPAAAAGLRALSRPLADALDGWIGTQVHTIVSSGAFATAWDEANRQAHSQMVAVLTGKTDGITQVQDGAVTIDLAAFIATVKEQLVAAGFGLAANIPTIDARFTVFESTDLDKAQRGFRALSALAHTLPVLGVLLLAAAIALARDRRRTVTTAALVVAGSMLVLGIALNGARTLYLDALSGQDISQTTAELFYDTIVRFIRFNLRALLVLTLAVALVAWLAGPSPSARAVRRGSGRLLDTVRSGSDRLGLDTGFVGVFLHRNRTAVRVAIGAVVLVVYALADHPTGAWTLTLIVVAALVLLVLEVIARLAPHELPHDPGHKPGPPASSGGQDAAEPHV